MLELVLLSSLVTAQFTAGGQTQPGLPAGCVGSFPNIPDCIKYNWSLPYADQCAPAGPYPVSGQQVYIGDATNFCINLPNPDSIFLQNNFYSHSLLPTIVQAEGYVRAFCVGNYTTPGALPIPDGGIRSAHVVKYANYIQLHGTLDCARLNINCTQSAPDAYDDGGQYDDGQFKNCGKEPYSGVDETVNPGMPHYVEMAGDGQFCMRVCVSSEETVGGKCDLTQDTKGCFSFMGVTFQEGFTTTDINGVTTSANVNLPPLLTSTTTTTQSVAGTSAASGNPVPTAAGGNANAQKNSATSKIPLISLGTLIFVVLEALFN